MLIGNAVYKYTFEKKTIKRYKQKQKQRNSDACLVYQACVLAHQLSYEKLLNQQMQVKICLQICSHPLSPSPCVPWTTSCFILAWSSSLASISEGWPVLFWRPQTKFVASRVRATLLRGWGSWENSKFWECCLFLCAIRKFICLAHAWRLNQAAVQLQRVFFSFVQEMYPENIWEEILSVGVYKLPVRSPLRAMEWKNSVNGAISYPSENPGLGFLLIPSQPLSPIYPLC